MSGYRFAYNELRPLMLSSRAPHDSAWSHWASREVAAVLLDVLDVDKWVMEEVMEMAAVRGWPDGD